MTITQPKGRLGPRRFSKRTFIRMDKNGTPHKSVTGPSLIMMLDYWGVRKSINNGNEGKPFSALNEWEKADLHPRAKSVYRHRISQAHTDHGGNHELATTLNVAWETTERLFRKHGIEI